MKNILIVCAMPKEAMRISDKLSLKQINEKIFRKDNISLLITGIGKQKTAINLTQYLCANINPDLIINIGYVGSTDLKIGSWVNVTKSYNYEWYIPGEEQYSMLDYGNKDLNIINDAELTKCECYSAESFVTKTQLEGHIVFDMELHSIALICDMKNIELIALKKVSDNLSLDKYYDNLQSSEVFELESSLKYLEKLL